MKVNTETGLKLRPMKIGLVEKSWQKKNGITA